MSNLSDFLLGSQNPQQVTSSSSTSQSLPNWLTQYQQGLVGNSANLIPQTTSNLQSALSPLSSATPYLGASQSTLSSALAGPNGVSLAQPSVTAASGVVNNAISPANSGTTAAGPYMKEANATFNNPATVGSYMSPYLQDVMAYNTQLSNQNLENQVLPAVESQFIGNGTFGSSPMGTAMGQQINLAEQNLQAQNLAAANQGYQEAGQLFNADAARQAGLAQTAGTLATQQQGAELQGASTLGSLGTALGQLGNTAQQNQLQGANLYGSLGSTAGQLGATGNSELLSQLGLLTSEAGINGGQTVTTQGSYPWESSVQGGYGSSPLGSAFASLTASGGLSSFLNDGNAGGYNGISNLSADQALLNSTLGAGTASNLGTANDANSFLNNPLPYATISPDLSGGLTDVSSLTSGLGDFSFARGGHVSLARGAAPPRLFAAADGGAVTVPTISEDLALANPNAIYTPQMQSSLPAALTASPFPQQNYPMPSSGSGTSSLAGALNGQPSGNSGLLGDLKTAKNLYNLTNDVSSLGGANFGSLADLQGANDASVASLTSGLSAGADPALAAADAGLSAGVGDVAGEAGIDLSSALAAPTDAAIESSIDAGLEGAGETGLASTLGLSTVAPYLAPIALGVGALVSSLTKPNNPDKINTGLASMEGMSVNPLGKLPSGNSVLFDNDLGVGAGTQSSQGSGEIYQLQPGGSAANNSAYKWIGQGNSTNLENDAHNLNSWLNSGAVVDQNGNYVPTNAAGERTLGGLSDIYNQTGGQKGWGMSENEFISSLHSLLSSGAYTSGDAFGRGN